MSSTGLIQEAILILAGHPSDHQPANPELDTYYHPSAIHSLGQLTQISSIYQEIRSFTNRPTHSISIAAFNSAISIELGNYQNLLIQLETKLLTHHPSLVPANQHQLPSPPLTAILAQVKTWLPIFQGLSKLIHQLLDQQQQQQQHQHLLISSPQLIQSIYPHSLTGSPQLAQIFSRLQNSIESVWIDQFRSFVLYGKAPIDQNLNHLFYTHPTTSNPQQQQSFRFSFCQDGLPQLPFLQPIDQLNQSIQQICHALSILKLLIHPNPHQSTSKLHSTTQIILPSELQTQLRLALQSINSLSHPRFRMAIKNVQEILSNYLFSTYLTPDILSNTLGTLTDVFFLRHSTFAGNLVDGMIRLKARRAGMVGGDQPRIRRLASLSERELDVVLLKAGISTELGEDPTGRQLDLDGFSFALLTINGDSQDPVPTGDRQAPLIERTFSQSILNRAQPVLLTYSPRPGLSLFLTKPVCESYSKIHSCLFAFLIAQQTFKDCWRELTQKERLRSRIIAKPRGILGGAHAGEIERMAFEGLRRMGWFINLMVDYFFRDVIEQSIQLLAKEINEHYQHSSNSQLGMEDQSEGESARTKGTSSDFFKIHASFLGLVETGLGLKNPRSSAIMKDLLNCCSDFLLDLESWSFELVPNLLSGLTATKLAEDELDDVQEGEEDQSRGPTTILFDRELRLTRALDSFNHLIRQLIVELRKDDSHQLSPLSDPSSSSAYHDFHAGRSSSNTEFTLKASAFRRSCLDSLLLKFDFNLWFSSPH